MTTASNYYWGFKNGEHVATYKSKARANKALDRPFDKRTIDYVSPAPYVQVSDDGKFALISERGNHTLVMVGDPAFPDQPVGSVADPENFEIAIDAAEEEIRCLMADARLEFGL